jgi:nucleoside-specific outer membrane channel protein Tsx
MPEYVENVRSGTDFAFPIFFKLRINFYRKHSGTPSMRTSNEQNHRNQGMRLLNKHHCWTSSSKVFENVNL